jgi:hypothetical protein
MLIPQVQLVYLIGINTSLLRTYLPTDMDDAARWYLPTFCHGT